MLDGPRQPSDPQAAYQKSRAQYGWTEDLSLLTADELADRAEAGLAALPPEKLDEARRLGWV